MIENPFEMVRALIWNAPSINLRVALAKLVNSLESEWEQIAHLEEEEIFMSDLDSESILDLIATSLAGLVQVRLQDSAEPATLDGNVDREQRSYTPEEIEQIVRGETPMLYGLDTEDDKKEE